MCTTVVCSDVFTGLLISLWTIIQTSFHIVWAIGGYNFYFCKIKPTNCWITIVYLTYFYNRHCGDINLVEERNYTCNNQSVDGDVYEIVEAILHHAHLPEQSLAATRTISYISIFIISDSLWIMAAFLLFAGTCFQVKNHLSLLFYTPWLLLAIFVSLMDVVAAVHFGLDMLQIHNYTSWLRFVGVDNYKEFASYDAHQTSRFIPVGPAISLSLLFSRLMIFWVLNVVNVFQVMALAELAFQGNLDGNRKTPTSRSRRRRTEIKKDSSAESRIKSWQQFYGSAETISKASTASLESADCKKQSNSEENNIYSLATLRESRISN